MQLSGITFGMNNAVTLRKHQLETMPADVAVFDYNNDGVTDICFVNESGRFRGEDAQLTDSMK